MKKIPVSIQTGWLTLIVVYFSMLSPTALKASIICIPYPQTTLADTLIESDTVIMARENVDKPYSFYVVEVLKGTNQTDEFNEFINSSARRKLKNNPNDTVVFKKKTPDSGWQHIAYADLEYQKFIRAIIKQSARWKQSRAHGLRIDFFAEHLNHNHRSISEQAYLEVGRAPYVSIKRIAGTIQRQQIYEFLAKWQLIEWHSLYILMLGQSHHPEDLAYIRKNLESAAAHKLKVNLAAWVTAYIESHPDTGVEAIENMFFGSKGRTRDELQEVLKGLSVLGYDSRFGFRTETLKRQRSIVSSYSTLLDNYPMMAGAVAKDLTNWKVQALIEQLSTIIENEPTLDPASKLTVSYYLAIAPGFPLISKHH